MEIFEFMLLNFDMIVVKMFVKWVFRLDYFLNLVIMLDRIIVRNFLNEVREDVFLLIMLNFMFMMNVCWNIVGVLEEVRYIV